MRENENESEIWRGPVVFYFFWSVHEDALDNFFTAFQEGASPSNALYCLH